MSKAKKSPSKKELFADARKFFDLRELFPKSKGLRVDRLTDYQVKKIKKVLAEAEEKAGGASKLRDNFIPLKRTKGAKKFIEDSGLGKAFKGALIPGGTKTNKKASVVNGMLQFQRGGRYTGMLPLDARTEKSLLRDIRSNGQYINHPEIVTYISTSSGIIKGVNVQLDSGKWTRVKVEGQTSNGEAALDKIELLALALFNKYAAMAKGGETRENGRRAAHPSKWGLSLLIEER